MELQRQIVVDILEDVDGKIGLSELHEDCVIRELLEETGLDIIDTHNLHRLRYMGESVEDRMQIYFAGIPGVVVVHEYILNLPDSLWKEMYVTIEGDNENTFEWVLLK